MCPKLQTQVRERAVRKGETEGRVKGKGGGGEREIKNKI